ncbi:hypothetical protein PTTG_07171 [Puccinia triticina 1-1 BBBD Race 1]|uniref:Uncharacterized protein n=1 Tax=Puccinia triticina (isolate 1-1 / race 1 (BBBD)) TaxID=630390 RepID=A0A180GAT7_PUCT1|nr:hypothetical protein PTTG_07171 [Puccinia triticina 1-1 BBBD Race 1]
MDHQSLIENILNSQAAILSGSRMIQSVILDTAIILAEEDKEDKHQPKHGGSQPGQSPNLPRNFEAGYQQLVKDYFSNSTTYTEVLFWQRFQMHRPLFLKIVHDVTAHDQYFVQKRKRLLHQFESLPTEALPMQTTSIFAYLKVQPLKV